MGSNTINKMLQQDTIKWVYLHKLAQLFLDTYILRNATKKIAIGICYEYQKHIIKYTA